MSRHPTSRGVTLLEVSLSVMLVALLIGTAYHLLQAEAQALRSIRHANLALFALEGLRNRILAEIQAGRPVDLAKAQALAADFQLPVRLAVQEVELPLRGRPERLLRLVLLVPPDPAGVPGRRYVREVLLR